jgi:hypothetical protein
VQTGLLGQAVELDCQNNMNPDRCFARILNDGRLTCGALAILSKTIQRSVARGAKPPVAMSVLDGDERI